MPAVRQFETDDEAVALANDTEFGLTARDRADRARGFAGRSAGAVGQIWVNDNYQQNPEGVWGGDKMSGTGWELSPHGLFDMTGVKEINGDGRAWRWNPSTDRCSTTDQTRAVLVCSPGDRPCWTRREPSSVAERISASQARCPPRTPNSRPLNTR